MLLSPEKCFGSEYQSHSINFLQDFSRFFGTAYIPRRSSNTPYFVIVQRVFNDEVYEAKVWNFVFLKIAQYVIQHNSMYQGRFLDMDAVSSFPYDGPLSGVIVYDNKADYFSTTTSAVFSTNYSIGKTHSYVSIPHDTQL